MPAACCSFPIGNRRWGDPVPLGPFHRRGLDLEEDEQALESSRGLSHSSKNLMESSSALAEHRDEALAAS